MQDCYDAADRGSVCLAFYYVVKGGGLGRSLRGIVSSDMISQVAKSICHLHEQIELKLH